MKNKPTLYIDNITRQTMIIDCGRVANSFWSRFKGLLGVRYLAPGDGLLITASNAIHTHFMFMPIDVFYVSEEHVITDIDIALSPWCIGRPRRDACHVIEVPVGTVTRTHSMVGDELKIITQ